MVAPADRSAKEKMRRELLQKIAFFGTPEKNFADSGLWTFIEYVQTKNEHTRKASPLPRGEDGQILPYIRATLWLMLANPVLLVAKSRQMMISWLCSIFWVWYQKSAPYGLGLVQSKEEGAAKAIVTMGSDNPMGGRMSFIEHHLPPWLRDQNITSKKGNNSGQLVYDNHSMTVAAAQGEDKPRSYTLTWYFGDEAAFQPEFEGAYGALLATIENGGRSTMVSTAQESFFADLVSPPYCSDGKRPTWNTVENELDGLPRGLKMSMSKYGIPVLWLHYTADPDKDPARNGAEWFERESKKAGGVMSPKWQREREIDFNITGGIPVFTFASDPTSPIWTPMPVEKDVIRRVDEKKSELYAGYDHGSRNPSALIVWEFHRDGRIEAIWEHYKPNLDFARHCEELRECPYWDYIKYIKADPSVINRRSQYEAKGMATLGQYYRRHGVPLVGGRMGVAEQVAIERFLGDYWRDSQNPRAFISAACPNLRYEVQNLRWEEHTSALTAQRKNNPERIMDKNNHAWDASAYVIDSRPRPAQLPENPTPYLSMKWVMDRADAQRRAAEMSGKYV